MFFDGGADLPGWAYKPIEPRVVWGHAPPGKFGFF